MAVFKFRNLTNGQASPLPPGEFTVGRADDAYVHLEDVSVSWLHARLINNDQGFFVEDLGSANGTSLRGAPLTGRMKVGFGDLISIGDVPFRIDPEVPGEISITPSPGLQRVARNTIRRETERLPNRAGVGTMRPPAVPINAPTQHTPSAADSEVLKPASLRETSSITAPAPTEVSSTGALPQSQGALIRKSVPLPTLVRLMQSPETETKAAPVTETPRLVSREELSPVRAEPIAAITAPPAEIEEEEASEESPTRSGGMGWTMATVFLAGLGVGLLLGLFFAKIFMEIGGKAAGLP